MSNKTSKIRIRLDSRESDDLAGKLPKLAGDLLREEPDEMDLATFIGFIGRLERITRKLMKGERAVSGDVLSSEIMIVIPIVVKCNVFRHFRQINIHFSVFSALSLFQLSLDFSHDYYVFIGSFCKAA